MPKIERQVSISGVGEGFPDYKREVYRARQIWGYVPEYGESFLWALIICMDNPGAYNFTRNPLAVGETVELVDPFTGLNGINALANEDYLLKEFWFNFDQPVRFEMIQDAIGDESCECHVPAFAHPAWNGLPIGWTRNQCEPITVASKTTMTVTNLGAATARGKAWVCGFRKIGAYTWY